MNQSANLIKTGHNHAFPKAAVGMGWGLLILGVLLLITSGDLITFFFILLGGFLVTTRDGVYLDLETNTYKSYVSYFWIDVGKWKRLDLYPHMSILKARMTSEGGGAFLPGVVMIAPSAQTTGEDVRYELCLLSKSHRTRIPLGRFESYDEAKDVANQISDQTEVSYVKYSPKLSAKSKARRDKRRR